MVYTRVAGNVAIKELQSGERTIVKKTRHDKSGGGMQIGRKFENESGINMLWIQQNTKKTQKNGGQNPDITGCTIC